MDSLTHLAAGVLTPLAFPRTPLRAAVIGFGIAIGELPDIDVIFGVSPKALLLLHRGVTHALFWQPVLVLLAVIPFYLWMHCNRPKLLDYSSQGEHVSIRPSSGTLNFFAMYFMALIAGVVHIYLDSLTTFGTRIFLPFSDLRVGLPAMFIVDPLFTVPLLVLMIAALRQKPERAPYRPYPLEPLPDCPQGIAVASGRARKLAIAGLAWVLLYPLAALSLNGLVASRYAPELAPGGKLSLLPEPLAPMIWKAVADDGDCYKLSTLNLLAPESAKNRESFRKPDPALLAALREQLALFEIYEKFCNFMVQEERPVSSLVQANYTRPIREFVFMDMRYLLSPESPARFTRLIQTYFTFEVRVNSSGGLMAYRFLQRGMTDRDTPWIEYSQSENALTNGRVRGGGAGKG